MPEDCCSVPNTSSEINNPNHKTAIQERYGAAAIEKESCLCTPVSFNPKYLEAIPEEVIERDYGCGDPTKWVKYNDVVLNHVSKNIRKLYFYAQESI